MILPVAGPAGEGGLQAAQASGGKVIGMWVDTDGYVSMPTYKSIIATSVGKAMDVAVFEAIKAVEGQHLHQRGLRRDPRRTRAPTWPRSTTATAKVSAETKSEIEQIKADIMAGTLKIES